jgi:hypothetical protein
MSVACPQSNEVSLRTGARCNSAHSTPTHTGGALELRGSRARTPGLRGAADHEGVGRDGRLHCAGARASRLTPRYTRRDTRCTCSTWHQAACTSAPRPPPQGAAKPKRTGHLQCVCSRPAVHTHSRRIKHVRQCQETGAWRGGQQKHSMLTQRAGAAKGPVKSAHPWGSGSGPRPGPGTGSPPRSPGWC